MSWTELGWAIFDVVLIVGAWEGTGYILRRLCGTKRIEVKRDKS